MSDGRRRDRGCARHAVLNGEEDVVGVVLALEASQLGGLRFRESGSADHLFAVEALTVGRREAHDTEAGSEHERLELVREVEEKGVDRLDLLLGRLLARLASRGEGAVASERETRERASRRAVWGGEGTRDH